MEFCKEDVSMNEYMLARLSDKVLHIPTPAIIDYDEDSKQMKMVKLDNMCIADYYGAEDSNTPEHIFENIRTIIKKLWESEIVYPDITGYNFIEDKGENVWIIDFGHAYVKKPSEKDNEFVQKFINGHNGWNPDFL